MALSKLVRTGVITGVTSVAVSLILFPAAQAGAELSAGAGVSGAPLQLADTAMAYAVKIRTAMGLNADPAYIAGVSDQPDATTDVMGTPLTPAETEDILDRQVITQWVTTVQAAANLEPGYGGTWIDQQAGGVLHIAAAGAGASDTFNRLRALLPADARVVLDRVDFPLSTVRAAHTSITNDLVARKPFEKYVMESAVSVRTNRVLLTVDSRMPLSEQALLATTYGPAVDVRTSDASGYYVPQNRDMPTGRVYAGAWLSSPLAECTVGYGATQNSIGDLYAVTAGHCRGQNWRQGYFNNGNAMGSSHQNHYLDGSGNCDCQAIGPLAASGQAGRDLLIENNALYNLTHTGGKSEQSPGTYVCLSGANSYDKNGGHLVCGTVVSDEVTIPYQADEFGNQFILTDATTSTIDVLKGDSGGPLNAGNALLGINGAYSPGFSQSAYSKVYNVAARISLTFLY